MGNLMLKRDYGLLGVKTKIKITPLLYGEKLSAVEVSPAYPISLSDPIIYTFPYKTWRTVYM